MEDREHVQLPSPPPAYIEDITYLCVWVGKKYGREYVERLGRAITKDTAPWNRQTLICITDNVPEGMSIGPWKAVAALPMPGEEGCWPKLQLFHPRFAIGAKGRPAFNVYLDLDVVITGELDGYIPKAGQDFLGTMKDPAREGHFNSSVMSWYGGTMTHIWEARARHWATRSPFGKPKGPWKGDQDFIRENLRIPWKPLDGIVSYKAELHGRPIPSRCRIAVFHGKPKMDELEYGNPYRRCWEG